MDKNFKIFLTGGGTGGSVVPLLALRDYISASENNFPTTNFVWIGTKGGVEEKMVADEMIPYIAIKSGKLRRYFSWQNFTDFFVILSAFFQSIEIIRQQKPDLIISAGSFVSVPLIWAGWFLGVPTLIHQQDVRPGLANKLMAPFAKIITVTFESSLSDYGNKAIWTGNPVRNQLASLNPNKDQAKKYFNINSDKPVIFVVGGGTGAIALNELVIKSLDILLPICEIIHVYGKDKGNEIKKDSYHAYEFLDTAGMSNAYTVSDLVVSRCGLGILTELSNLNKASILIPMPDSHQEDNANIFAKNKSAIVLNQKDLNAEKFSQSIINLLHNPELKKNLENKIGSVIKKNASKEIVKNISLLLK
ncbi:MAG: undecaprenyldiphospho-muramoylpentapeptide beta-N-acetylglucosaminyltransferase [Candidatus Magasanikbacteria bacterium]|nr:undecaprenyldiphospho-muramoylpentapeptide beta-N-acetylglucosaminyltransferase [Candidatus Magasanikbacteria bacterium]